MKRRLFVLVLSAALMVTATPVLAAAPATPEHPTWIVTLAPGTPATSHAARLVGPLGGSVQHVYRYVLNGFAFRGSEQAAQALERNPNVLRVEANRPVRMAAEEANNGFFRIDADDTYYAGDRGKTADGTPVRIAVLDTGVMTSHIDLAPNLDLAAGYNCIAPGQSPEDDQGHGTHVAGIAAAASQGEGMVGIASEASLVAVKVLDGNGYGSDAEVICGLDHVAGLALDGVPTVVNLSLGEAHAAESGCASSGIHQAICNLTDAGVTVVAAAGNSAADSTNSFYPAAYPETIAVSAFSALNGTPGNDGCQFFIDTFSYECDDELASFTNYGSVIDVTAPGVRVQSTTFDGGWGLNSGTSMAAPFASGVAALVLAANPGLTPDAVRSIMQTSGECPDGTVADAATCVGHGEWVIPSLFDPNGLPDPDGIPEPLIDAAAAVAAASPSGPDVTDPTVSITAPTDGATVAGVVAVAADASDNVEVAQVEFFADGSSIGIDTVTPYSMEWDSTSVADGSVAISATATDTTGNTATEAVSVTINNADVTDPVVTITSPADGATYEAGVDVVTVDYACSDAGSGIDTCIGDLPDGATLDTSTPGVGFTFSVIGTDIAGNSTSVAHTYDIVDTTEPVITLLGDNPLIHEAGEPFTDPGAVVTDNVDMTVTIAGVSNVDPGAVGAYTITYDHSDAAGNIATTVARSVDVVDTVAPVVTITSPTDGAVFELDTTVLADYACTDGGSGITSCSGDVESGLAFDTATEGSHTFAVTGTDGVGNTTTVIHNYTVSAAPDITPPVVTLTTPADLAIYEAGIDSITVGYACFDDESGVVSCEGTLPDGATLDTSVPVADVPFTVTGIDAADNTTAVTHTYSVVDTTAPTVTLTSPADGDSVGGMLDVTATADDLVEVAGVEFFVGTESIGVDETFPYEAAWDSTAVADGLYEISATATDTTGNSTTDTISVTVDNTTSAVDTAVSEVTRYGSVSGTYVDTHVADGFAEVITEIESGGKPSNRTSRLEHTWTIPFGGGDGTVHLVTMSSLSTDGDTFTFAYSFNGVSWTDMFIVDSTTNSEYDFALPGGRPAGDLFIRVTDSDRTSGHRSLDWVSVDYLSVESQPSSGEPEIVLEATTSKVAAVNGVDLSWSAVGTLPYSVWRDDEMIAEGLTETTHRDDLGKKPVGSFTYWVCDLSGVLCSNEVTVEF